MKMNTILMIVGLAIFFVGLILTVTEKKETPDNSHPSAPQTVDERQDPSSGIPSSDNAGAIELPSQPTRTNVTYNTSSPNNTTAKDEAKRKGNDFEDYVADLLTANGVKIKEWNKGTVTEKGAFSENALNPDMFVADKAPKVNLEYWIECKYRSTIPSDGFRLEEKQLNRYADKQRETKRKVFIALGTGGQPSNPAAFHIIPLDSLRRFKHIPEKYLSHYILTAPETNLRKYLRDYFFNEVFDHSPK